MDSSRVSVLSFLDNPSSHHVPALISANIPQTLPPRDAIGLCQAMRSAVPFSINRSSILCFTGPGSDEVIGTVALESAIAAAGQVNLRVLLVDAVADPEGSRKPLLAGLRTTLHYALRTESPINEAIATVRGSHLSYTCLTHAGQGETAIPVLASLKKLLEELRSSYDLIVINAGSIMDSALAPELSKLADGSVMVVEAERTRTPVALRAKTLIESAGGRVIGAVLGNRRYHIPDAFYKWL